MELGLGEFRQQLRPHHRKCDQAADAQGDGEPRQPADRYQKPRGQEEYCKDGSKRKDGKPLKAGAVAHRYVIDRVERM